MQTREDSDSSVGCKFGEKDRFGRIGFGNNGKNNGNYIGKRKNSGKFAGIFGNKIGKAGVLYIKGGDNCVL